MKEKKDRFAALRAALQDLGIKNTSDSNLTQKYLLNWERVASAIENGQKQNAYFHMGTLLSIWLEAMDRLDETNEGREEDSVRT